MYRREMYTGRMIEDLVTMVERVEDMVREEYEFDLARMAAPAGYLPQYSYSEELAVM